MTLLTAILLALSEIESGNNDNAIGSHGERSRYQITESAWKKNSTWDFKNWSRDSESAKVVAKRILSWNEKHFKAETKREPTIKETYAMWNLGFDGYRKRGFDYEKLPKSVKERCERFENLVKDFLK